MGGAASQYWQQSQSNKFLNILAIAGCECGLCPHNGATQLIANIAPLLRVPRCEDKYQTTQLCWLLVSRLARHVSGVMLCFHDGVCRLCVTNVSRFLFRDLLSCDILTIMTRQYTPSDSLHQEGCQDQVPAPGPSHEWSQWSPQCHCDH